MINPNVMNALMEVTKADKPTLFPFPMKMHIIFAALGIIFFVGRFIVQKRPCQVIMAAAIFVSLGLWLSESRFLYYAIAVIELVLIAAYVVTGAIFKAPQPEDDAENTEDDAEEASEEEEETDVADEDAADDEDASEASDEDESAEEEEPSDEETDSDDETEEDNEEASEEE